MEVADLFVARDDYWMIRPKTFLDWYFIAALYSSVQYSTMYRQNQLISKNKNSSGILVDPVGKCIDMYLSFLQTTI